MLPRFSSVLALLSLSGIGLLTYELLSASPNVPAITGLSLVTLSSLGYALSLRQMRQNAFRTAMSNYADRQIHRETRPTVPTFDAPSTAL